VLRTEDGFEAFVVVDEDGVPTARSRRLTLGPAQGNRVVVENGLTPGDRLITLGQQLVDDGGRVRVVTGAPDAARPVSPGREPRP
jgi:multidrug efflux pump subunit AcrA (membrane-fusion protein)